MVIFAGFHDKNVAGLDGVIYPVNGQHAAALDEDKHFIHIVYVTCFGVSGFPRFEHINAPTCNVGIAQMIRQQAGWRGVKVGNRELFHVHPILLRSCLNKDYNSNSMEKAQLKTTISFGEYGRFLKRYLSPRLSLVVLLGVTMLANIGLQLFNPQILRQFIDAATTGGARELLTRLAMTFIGIAVVQQVMNVVVTYITETLGWGATNDLRADLARYTLGLDMSFHAAHTPGEMIERIDGDVMALSNFFSRFLLEVFSNVLLVAGILIVLLLDDWRISLALGLFVAVTVALLLRLANIAVPAWEAERQASANLYGFLEERLSGTEDIRSNNAKNYVLDRFYRLTRDLMKKTISAGLKLNILLNTTWFLFSVGTAISYLVGAWLFKAGDISMGTVVLIVFYTGMLYWPIDRITQQMQDLQKAGASLIRIIGIQRTVGKIPGEADFGDPVEKCLPSGGLAVRFDHVTFGYDDSQSSSASQTITQPEPPLRGSLAEQEMLRKASQGEQPEKEMVLQDISFNMQPGRVVGLLGRTGSGKTTLTRLLFRLYDVDEGSIRFGSDCSVEGMVDLRDIHVQELRRRVGMVTQNIQLFNATVRDNLTFFDKDISDERIMAAIDDLGLHEWFRKLSKGLDTELESGGGGLSAGEAQLLAFTRIFLREPGLVILDEATSRLDPATEYLIERAVDKLVRGRSAIVVAHRLGTVQRADDIMILENGKMVEYGERERLAQDPTTRFYHLLQTGMEEVLA